MTKNRLQYPEMRNELISALSSLSDHEYQKEAWLKQNFPSNIKYDEFSYPVHVLFDNMDMNKKAHEYIGVSLYNKQEADVVSDVAKELERIFYIYGTEQSDEFYINLPDWPIVIATAKKAKEMLQNNDNKYT